MPRLVHTRYKLGMNRRDYHLHLDGYAAAARGAGLSDSPHGGSDGDLWRGGVRSWLDEHGNETGALDQAAREELFKAALELVTA